MTIQADLEHAHANLTQILDGITGALEALRDASQGEGYPTKASGAQRSPDHGAIVHDPTDPTDPGGTVTLTRPEAIMESTLTRTGNLATSDLAIVMGAAHTLLTSSTRALDVIVRYQRRVPTRARATDACPDDWCTSCWRDHQHHSPVTLRPTGEPFYAGLCRWCGDFRKNHKRLPSIEILQVRHQGKRVTMAMIDATKPTKPTKRRGRKA